MYNLDVNSASGTMNLLTLDPGCNTPRTPEILNTVLNMQNPLDGFVHGGDVKPPLKTSSLATRSHPLSASATTTCTIRAAPFNHSDSSNSSSCVSPREHRTVITGTASVQRNRTELIKASLKLTIEQKRKHQTDQDDNSLLDLDVYRKRVKKSECSDSDEDKMLTVGLTPEDEERRKRRRERNKIAATKCRLKKRERTANLMTESDILEQQNVEFKSQIDQLRKEQYKLDQVLDTHRRQCVMNIPPATREKLVAVSSSSNGINRRLSGMDSPLSSRSTNHQHHHHQSYSNNSSPSSVTAASTLSPSSSTNRPASVDLSANTYLHSTLEFYSSPITGGDCHLHQVRPSSVGFHHAHQHHQQLQHQQQLYGNVIRAPSITIIDDCVNDGAYTPHLTDMDQPNEPYDDYDYHVYVSDGAASQNMFSLMA